jgi:hypothetical protein
MSEDNTAWSDQCLLVMCPASPKLSFECSVTMCRLGVEKFEHVEVAVCTKMTRRFVGGALSQFADEQAMNRFYLRSLLNGHLWDLHLQAR